MPWKQAKKPVCKITLGLPRLNSTWSVRSVTLGGTRGHNKGHASTPACYLLLFQTLRELLAWRPWVSAYSWPNQSINGTTHTQCTKGLHFSACNMIGFGAFTLQYDWHTSIGCITCSFIITCVYVCESENWYTQNRIKVGTFREKDTRGSGGTY